LGGPGHGEPQWEEKVLSKKRKLLEKILKGSFKNVQFSEFVSLLEALGFDLERTQGSHYIYSHPRIPRPFPVQNEQGKAKPHQVRQLLQWIEQYDLELNGEDEA
jgi:predicted RNA binding protein YcfA (HicA-like mRNA interferase family)